MKHTLSALALIGFCAATVAAPVPAGNLLVNGGFESTVVAAGNWVNVATMPGWTWLAGPGTGFELRNNVVGSAQEGRNYIELDTNGNTTIGQYLDSLTSGASYDLSFWYSPREFQAAATNGVQVFWNGVQLGGVLTGLGGSENDWTQYQYRVTAQSGRNLLSFASVGNSDGMGGNLDNVSLNRVPEPGSLALTLAALSGMFLLPRSLRRQAEQRRAVALASTLKRDA
ncbi:MAG: PEP-CTERM sorting domain-containing protein [Burkholderiales bacterium]|nr:PEP-CTERM sorting domain-containing protein [Burkholderiales bacterium]